MTLIPITSIIPIVLIRMAKNTVGMIILIASATPLPFKGRGACKAGWGVAHKMNNSQIHDNIMNPMMHNFAKAFTLHDNSRCDYIFVIFLLWVPTFTR